MKKSLLLALMPLMVITSCSNPPSSTSSQCVINIPPSPLITNAKHFIVPTELRSNTYSQSDIRIETNLAFYEKGKADSHCPEYAMVYFTKGNSGNYSVENSVVLYETSNKEELEQFYFMLKEGYTPEEGSNIDENQIIYGGKVELKLSIDFFTESCGMEAIYFTFTNPKENSDEEIAPVGSTSFVYYKLENKKISISAVRCR